MSNRAYGFNQSDFAFETFEDEIIVLDLTTGTYFTLGGSAVDLWDPLIQGRAPARIARAMSEAYGISEAVAASALETLIASLTEENILVEAPAVEADIAFAQRAFAAPSYEKHADLQDLLTLDPIHDIDFIEGLAAFGALLTLFPTPGS